MLGFQTVRDGSFFFLQSHHSLLAHLGMKLTWDGSSRIPLTLGVADIHRLFNWLSETLANARHSDASLTDTVNKALGLSSDDAYEEMRQKHESMSWALPWIRKNMSDLLVQNRKSRFKDTQSPLLDVDPSSLKYPVGVSTSEVGFDHKFHLKEVSLYHWITFVCFVNICVKGRMWVCLFFFYKGSNFNNSVCAG